MRQGKEKSYTKGDSFNPRTRTGCDFRSNVEIHHCNFVSIHAPARGATRCWLCYRGYNKFQSTHPHGVRQLKIMGREEIEGFNPRTRTGCDGRVSFALQMRPVSIHAPARGATWEIVYNLRRKIVSIHAPARGATCLSEKAQVAYDSFNPRTRTGCDRHIKRVAPGPFVSIHAPARGATELIMLRATLTGVSIHAPARGATAISIRYCILVQYIAYCANVIILLSILFMLLTCHLT